MEGYHRSVLLKEVLGALTPAPSGAGRDAWYIDCTLGDGGHSIEVIVRGGKVVGIDVDPQALGRVQKRFEDLGIDKSKYRLIQGNFRDIKNLIEPVSPEGGRGEQTDVSDLKFAGAIFDLGVSSLQLMDPQRGFSFAKDGPLDMRMDPSLVVQALDLVNALPGKELYELFKELGEEKYSRRVADALVLAREVKPFSTTLELAGVVERAVGGRRDKIHPATRVFQALRIAVNDELEALKEGLNQVIDLIEKNGVILVISFHSLEDRIVKNTFKQWGYEGLGQVLTKKPILPTEAEVVENPRSKSAKMRIFKLYDYH